MVLSAPCQCQIAPGIADVLHNNATRRSPIRKPEDSSGSQTELKDAFVVQNRPRFPNVSFSILIVLGKHRSNKIQSLIVVLAATVIGNGDPLPRNTKPLQYIWILQSISNPYDPILLPGKVFGNLLRVCQNDIADDICCYLAIYLYVFKSKQDATGLAIFYLGLVLLQILRFSNPTKTYLETCEL